MSRVGKKPILIPPGVDVKINGQRITVKGPKGELSREFRPEVAFTVEDGKIAVRGEGARALWGTTRAIIANMVEGVTDGYQKRLEIEGVGYKANIEGNDLVLIVGFSHPVKIACPEGIKFSIEKNVISVAGADKE
jgi:large subunit ribosomal protein L6